MRNVTYWLNIGSKLHQYGCATRGVPSVYSRHVWGGKFPPPQKKIYHMSNTGVERSFSAMNRICSRLRQRLTPEHLDALLMVAQKVLTPGQPTKNLLEDIVYDWHGQRSRRVQIPSRETRHNGLNFV